MHFLNVAVLTAVAFALQGDATPNPIRVRHHRFETTSPPPKVAHPHKGPGGFLRRAVSGWTGGFIGNKAGGPGISRIGSTGGYRGGNGYAGPQSYQQNGYSQWGTFNQSSLPYYYGGGRGGQSGRPPWGKSTTQNTNPYTGAPRNGQTRSYTLVLAPCDIKPDGVQTTGAICVNGQYPGPLIEADYGDTLSIKVTNNLVGEGTSMHWHGFLQTGTNQQDGVPGVTQCPIPP